MKQPYLKKTPVNKSSYKNETTGLIHIHVPGLSGDFPGKLFSARMDNEKQITGEKRTDSIIMNDFFGALNY